MTSWTTSGLQNTPSTLPWHCLCPLVRSPHAGPATTPWWHLVPSLSYISCSAPASPLTGPDKGRWLIKVTDMVSIERGACFSAGLSTSVNLGFYQLCASGSFRADRWQSISSQPVSVTALRCLSVPGLICQTPLQTEINLQNHAGLFLRIF